MLVVMLLVVPVSSDGLGFRVDGLSNKAMILPGDFNIGLLYGVTEYTTDGYCNDVIDGEGGVQATEAARLSIQNINKRLDILPNVTLGMVSKCGVGGGGY